MGATRTRTGRIKLAVLPFRDLSGAEGEEYLGDGLTEELISQLSRFDPAGFAVISNSTARLYRNTDRSVQEIGAELDVDYVLEGSVMRSGDRLRITAQLTRAQNGLQIWAQRYDRPATDIFAIQGDVAGQISESLKLELAPAAARGRRSPSEIGVDTYEEYLKGRFSLNQRTEDGFRRGIEQFERVIRAEPGFAPAHAALADCYLLIGVHRAMPATAAFPASRRAAEQALEVDDTLGEANATLGILNVIYEREWDVASSHFARALALRPGYATAHHWHSVLLSVTGIHAAAVQAIERAREMDPLSLIINAALGWVLAFAGRYDEAIAQSQRTVKMDPDFHPGRTPMILSYASLGRLDEAIGELETIAGKPGGRTPIYLAGLAHAYGQAGRLEDARRIIEELDSIASRRYVSHYDMALAHLGLGDVERVLDLLESAFEDRDHALVYLNVDPRYETLRTQPRCRALLRRLGLSGH
jgi:TolB-like protein/Flp pilus assembly protein TadD